MSGFDKFIQSFTSTSVSDDKRAEARTKARSVAGQGDWLSIILDHHQAIDRAFAAVRSALDVASRRAAERNLATVLTGHSIAEEAVIYPALAEAGEKGHAETAYDEQAHAKMQMAALENTDPMSQDYIDRLNQLETAIKHHIFLEESKWFLELLNRSSPEQNRRLADRYREEFGRYMGQDRRSETTTMEPAAEPRSFTGDQDRDLSF